MAFEDAMPEGMKKMAGLLSEIADEAGYFFAENEERITLYHRTSNDPTAAAEAAPHFRVIGTALKKDGARAALINRLKGLLKGVPA